MLCGASLFHLTITVGGTNPVAESGIILYLVPPPLQDWAAKMLFLNGCSSIFPPCRESVKSNTPYNYLVPVSAPSFLNLHMLGNIHAYLCMCIFLILLHRPLCGASFHPPPFSVCFSFFPNNTLPTVFVSHI